MKVIFTVGGLSPEDGGPSRSIPALAAALVRSGLEVEVVTCESAPNQNAPLLPQEASVKTHLLPRSCRTAQWLGQTNGFTRTLGALSHGVKDCIFHDNGLWLPTNHAAAFAAQKLTRPLVISPRGMLTAWALHFRGWKKQMAWWLYQRRDLQAARVLHATSLAEAGEFRALGLTQPVAVIPNGVSLPPGVQEPEARSQFSGLRTVLFLSRLHPKKGLLNLVNAWALVRPKGWQVIIAGGDEAGHRAAVEAAIDAGGLQEAFRFTGAVNDGARWNLYREADLFVLPSLSENFGIVVAEALACGLPVITTCGTPWEELRRRQCGWWIEIGVQPLANALREAMALSDAERSAMGGRGRQLIEDQYTWPAIAGRMGALYEWMRGVGERPQFVLTEPASR